MTTPAEIKRFRIDIPESDLDDLAARLAATRWPDELAGAGTGYGMPLGVVQRLLLHGWPGSVQEFAGMIGPLTDPRVHGGDPSHAFHVVVPSLPGYGFSGPTTEPGWDSARMAKALAALMSRLGYARWGAAGGDAGALVGRELGILAPDGLIGVHLLQIFAFPSGDPAEMARLSDADRQSLSGTTADFQSQAGYQKIQQTRPQTLGYGLTDSPAGQLAWNAELWTGWGDYADYLHHRPRSGGRGPAGVLRRPWLRRHNTAICAPARLQSRPASGISLMSTERSRWCGRSRSCRLS